VLHHAEKHNWRHRDISVGNIMIFNNRGFLIDWELAQHSQLLNNAQPRVPDHTGTWQFISAARLLDPINSQHLAMDDMESTFWVFLWLALRYGQHNLAPDTLRSELTDIFDKMTPKDGLPTGGAIKQLILMKPNDDEALPTKFIPVAVSDLLEFMQSTFHPRYMEVKKRKPRPLDTAEQRAERETRYHQDLERRKKDMALLANSTHLRNQFKLSSTLDWSNDCGPIKRNISDAFRANAAPFVSKRKHSARTSSTPLPVEPSTGPTPSRLAREGEDEDSDAGETRSPSKRQRIVGAVGTKKGKESVVRAYESE